MSRSAERTRFGDNVRVQIRFAAAIATLAATLSGAVSLGQRQSDGPEAAIRSLVMAMYANDVAAYNRVTIPHPLRERLTTGGRVNQERLDALKEYPESLQIRQRRPPMFRGVEARAGANGDFAVGTTALFTVAHGG